MTELPVSITGDPSSTLHTALQLLESDKFDANVPKEIPGGASLTMLPIQGQRALTYDAAPVIEMVLSLSKDVGVAVIATYICDKLIPRKQRIKLEINKRTIEIEKGEITRVIEEAIKITPSK